MSTPVPIPGGGPPPPPPNNSSAPPWAKQGLLPPPGGPMMGKILLLSLSFCCFQTIAGRHILPKYKDLVLSTELIRQVGHPREIGKLRVGVLVLGQHSDLVVSDHHKAILM